MVGLILSPIPYIPRYVADAAVFDGSNDRATVAGDLTGNADSKLGLVSLWFKRGATGALQYLYGIDSNFAEISFLATNKIRIRFADTAGNQTFQMDSNTAISDTTTWHHLLASWNLATPVAHLYVDDANDEAAGSTEGTQDRDYARSGHFLGSYGSGNLFNGALFDMYINFAAYLDITQEANRRKFRSAAGKPVNLGPSGALPTGTSPIMFFHLVDGATADTFATNKGAGGGFTLTGALTTAPTSPTD